MGVLSGERGGKLLPKLLKPGELASKEQKDTFKKEAGIDGLGDVGRLIEVGIGACSVSLRLPRLPLFLPRAWNGVGSKVGQWYKEGGVGGGVGGGGQ